MNIRGSSNGRTPGFPACRQAGVLAINMNFVYILISENKNNWSYVGCTGNLEQRFKDHQSGKVKSTKGYRPLKLVYSEECNNKTEARERELFLKTGSGREEKNEILNNSGIV